jgi:hypothetical protein
MPIAAFSDTVTWMTEGIVGLETGLSASGILPFPIQGFVIGLMALTTFILFSYKNRKRQLALGKLNFLLILGLIVIIYVSIDSIAADLSTGIENVVYGWGTYLPIIALAFQLLANRGVKRDEELIRSVERLR